MQRQITVEQLVQAGIDSFKASIYIRMPGSVLDYDPDKQTATVQPMVNDARFDLDTGAVVFEPWKPIQNVPVCWPRFGNGFVIAGFLEQNDQVVLEAFDLDPGPWRAQGRSTQPVNPNDVRRLGGNYWSALPVDLTGPITDSDVTGGAALVLGFGGGATIVVDHSTITIGKSASKVDIAGGFPAQGVARLADMVAGIFPITTASTKVFAGG